MTTSAAELQRLAGIADAHDSGAYRDSELVTPDGPELVAAVQGFIRRYVVVSDHALLATALWVLHTHAIDAAYATPYLHIHSPQRRCGKTRFFEVLSLLVARPWHTARTSTAALIRKVASDKITLLLDETDALFGSDKEYVETLRGILNAGNSRSVMATLCVGREHKVQDFPVFGPKALAGIGTLPDTIADRSIAIEMKRRLPSEPVGRFRRRLIQAEADALRSRIESWVAENLDALRDANPQLPDQLSDRAQDGWEPLLAIADLCDVGADAVAAAIALAGHEPEPEDLGLRTLSDLHRVFEDRDRLSSTEVVVALRGIEDGPYGAFRSRDFDERELAKRLKPFGIRPEQMKIDGRNVRGYERAALAEVWDRYLPGCTARDGATNATTATFPENRTESGSGLEAGSASERYDDALGSGVAVVAAIPDTWTGLEPDEEVL
jgi:hypothetical protein